MPLVPDISEDLRLAIAHLDHVPPALWLLTYPLPDQQKRLGIMKDYFKAVQQSLVDHYSGVDAGHEAQSLPITDPRLRVYQQAEEYRLLYEIFQSGWALIKDIPEIKVYGQPGALLRAVFDKDAAAMMQQAIDGYNAWTVYQEKEIEKLKTRILKGALHKPAEKKKDPTTLRVIKRRMKHRLEVVIVLHTCRQAPKEFKDLHRKIKAFDTFHVELKQEFWDKTASAKIPGQTWVNGRLQA
jgi:hypothetical protein